MVDGGYCANNPSLFALTDAIGASGINPNRIRLLSIGTGLYPERWRLTTKLLKTATPTFATLLRTGSKTVEVLRELLYPSIATVRIDEATIEERMRTDIVECDIRKLEAINQFGRESFRKYEDEIYELLNVEAIMS